MFAIFVRKDFLPDPVSTHTGEHTRKRSHMFVKLVVNVLQHLPTCIITERLRVKKKLNPCDECTRSFSTPGDLRNHMKVHMRGSNTPQHTVDNLKQDKLGEKHSNKKLYKQG